MEDKKRCPGVVPTVSVPYVEVTPYAERPPLLPLGGYSDDELAKELQRRADARAASNIVEEFEIIAIGGTNKVNKGRVSTYEQAEQEIKEQLVRDWNAGVKGRYQIEKVYTVRRG